MLARPHLGGMAPGKAVVHFGSGVAGSFPQFRGEFHHFPSPVRGIVQGTAGHITHQHLFQGDGLSTELQPVGIVLLGDAVLVFHRQGQP